MARLGRLFVGALLFRALLGLGVVLAVGGWLALGGAEQTVRSITAPARIAELDDRAKRQAERGQRAAARKTRRELEAVREAPSGPGAFAGSLLGDVLAAVWGVARAGLAGAALLGAPLLASRSLARRRRRYRRFWLRPSLTEVVDPERTARMWEAWHQQQSHRWWERVLRGQPSVAVEANAIPTCDGGSELRVGVVLSDSPRVEGFIGRLRGAWQHVHVEEDDSGGPPWVEWTIRLKKRHRFSPRAIAIVTAGRRDGVGEHVVDDLRALSAEVREPFTVQLALVPTPGPFERRARRWFAGSARPGGRDPVADSEADGAARALARRGLYFGDLRVSARRRGIAEQVAGALQGGLRAQNLLRPRWMVARRRLYAARVRRGVANPIPSWRRGVFSSSECAALWALPTPFREAGETRAEIEPRLEPSSRIPRVERESALLETQRGEYVRIADASLRRGVALVGAPEMGKTATLLRWFLPLVGGAPRTAGVLLDPKGDGAEAALRALPGGLTIHYIDFRDPAAGFSPLGGERSLSESAEAVTGAMIEATRTDQGESTVLASSKRFIHQVVMAARYAFDPPTFWHTWQLCSASEQAVETRLRLAREFAAEREMAGVAMAFEELSVQLRGARSAMIQRLDAPSNKFYMLTDPTVDRVLRHPHQVDIDEVVRRREVLVVNGAMGQLGPELTSMLMLMLLAMVHRSILKQQGLPASERSRVALGLDEAHLFFSPTLQQMLAMDRSAGLMAALAWHFSEQIADRAQRAGALALLRNRIFFALEHQDARRLSELLQPIHVDSLHARQEVREVVRIGPEVLSNLSQFRAAVDQQHEGQKVPSWIGRTLPIDGRDELAEEHLRRQRERGGGPVSDAELALPPGLTSDTEARPGRGNGAEAGEGGGRTREATGRRGREAGGGRPSGESAGEVESPGGREEKSEADAHGEGESPGERVAEAPRGGGSGKGPGGEEARIAAAIPAPGTPTSAPLAASYGELARYESPPEFRGASAARRRIPPPAATARGRGRRRASARRGSRASGSWTSRARCPTARSSACWGRSGGCRSSARGRSGSTWCPGWARARCSGD